VARLAEAIYQEPELPAGTFDPARLAVLADALEDAGCTDADLLGIIRFFSVDLDHPLGGKRLTGRPGFCRGTPEVRKVMTESEWLSCSEPEKMVAFLHRPAGDRKLRLFAGACCQRIRHLFLDERDREGSRTRRAVVGLHLFPDDHYRKAGAVAERYAEGLVTEEELARALYPPGWWLSNPGWENVMGWAAGTRAWKSASLYRRSGKADDWPSRWHQDQADEFTGQAALLRDIFGPLPFGAVAFDPTWLTWNGGTVVHLAQSIYDDRAFDRLPILADALEEAGCADPDILGHCRSGGGHVRGCWVVDLCSGKEVSPTGGPTVGS
jgi:hypothetical protein